MSPDAGHSRFAWWLLHKPSEGLRPKIDGTACQIYLQVLESPDVMRVRERKAGGGMVRSKANYLQRTTKSKPPTANHPHGRAGMRRLCQAWPPVGRSNLREGGGAPI